MAFSGAVKIGDLNDFIAPSQACVVSLQGQKHPQQASAQQRAAAEQQPVPKEGLQLNATRLSKRRATQHKAPTAVVTLDALDAAAAASVADPAPQQQQQQQQQQLPIAPAASGPAAAAAAPAPAAPAAPAAAAAPSGFQQTVLTGDAADGPQAVKVSLNDCLACSGCVTSAETVLLQAQSLREFVARCGDADAHVVVSVSPQSRASLAALHGIPPEQVQDRLAAFLRSQLAVDLVLDTTLGQGLALAEAAAEFLARYRARQQAVAGAPASSEAAAAAAAAAAAGSGGSGAGAAAPAPGPLPMLASSCPGWVCYAEKTHGAYVLPHISTSRSPQGMMGALVKRLLCAPAPAHGSGGGGGGGWDPSRVYHVTVMPCYDKKLEASRDDFVVPGTSVAEVDSSLTTGEVQQLLEQYGAGDMRALPPGRSDGLLKLLLSAAAPASQHGDGRNNQQQQQQPAQQQPAQQQQAQQPPLRLPEPLLHAQPGSSGGYADHVFRVAARQLFGVDVDAALAGAAAAGQQQPQVSAACGGGGGGGAGASGRGVGTQHCVAQPADGAASSSRPPGAPHRRQPLPWRALRNADMQELTLSDACGAPLLRFARAYGFRNIQTVVRQIRGGRCAYDYVEVMACPAGCLNGGGQLKPPSGTTPAQLVEQLELLYYRQQLAQQQCGAGGTGGGSSCGGGGGGGARDGAALSRGQQQQQRFKVSPSVIQVLQDGRELAAAAAAAAAGHVQGLALAPDCIDARSLAAVYERVLGGSGPGSPAAAGLLHTQYHKREKTVTSTLSDW